MKRTKSYHESLIEDLKNRDEAVGYLNTALEQGDAKMFLVALRNVAEAQGGLSRVARLTNLNRSNLYKMLSKKGRPEIQSVNKVLGVLGFSLHVATNAKTASRLAKAA